ncbi:MAG: hypothetical protein IJH40_08915 [Ruminococcus sp.]|uniref:hypothetical protein n=1 Tax=Ruminococcus sp. TaxID=41978 RepID=UPI002872CEF5|nr:hypothetical protein [Ruminococcus sp.]MBQ3285744.1 hypothetical protein [Ruminococcus sp.]
MEENKDGKIKQLEHDNARLKSALRGIAAHHAEIQKLLDEVHDLLYANEQTDTTPVTDEDVKSLLKKYSRL